MIYSKGCGGDFGRLADSDEKGKRRINSMEDVEGGSEFSMNKCWKQKDLWVVVLIKFVCLQFALSVQHFNISTRGKVQIDQTSKKFLSNRCLRTCGMNRA